METINRCVLVVKGKQPFLEWARNLPDPSPDLTLDRVQDDSHTYLLPSYEMKDQQEGLLKEFYKEIFEQELVAWWREESAWPRKRTLTMFKEWFDVEFHSMAIDLVDDEIVKE